VPFEIDQLAKDFAPWSISKAGLEGTCPKQFQYKYIDKTAAEVAAHSTSRVGTTAHKILELCAGGTSKKAAITTAVEENKLTINEIETLATMQDNIDAFLVKFDFFCKENGVTEVLLEKQWGLDSDGNAVGFKDPNCFFRGVVDLGVVTRDKDLVVIDHKSGKASDISKGDKYKKQLNSYAVMGLANVGDIGGFRGAINFLQGKDLIQWLPYVDAEHIKNRLTPWLFRHINEMAANLVAQYEARPKLRWPCEWCSYQLSCSSYQEMVRGASI
jgi:hypothetical protein